MPNSPLDRFYFEITDIIGRNYKGYYIKYVEHKFQITKTCSPHIPYVIKYESETSTSFTRQTSTFYLDFKIYDKYLNKNLNCIEFSLYVNQLSFSTSNPKLTANYLCTEVQC